MKRVAFSLAIFLIAFALSSSAQTRNLVRTFTATAPQTDVNTLTSSGLREVKQSVVYLDGLGRPDQSVVKQGSLNTSNGVTADMVTPFEYNTYGREIKKYLPYVASTSDGLYKTNASADQLSFNQGWYSSQNENTFYGQTNYEASPLNRVTKQMAPGASWAGNGVGVSTSYYVNTPIDAVRIWNVQDVSGDFGTFSSAGIYDAGLLYKSATTDEQGHEVIEFKDKEGRVILKKVQLTAGADDGTTGSGHSGWVCTYYIYDDLGQLRGVIQPKGVDQMNTSGNWNLDATNNPVILSELCFRYKYDARGRMIMKKVPGADPVYMVYDARDRLVMTQDGNMRAQGSWLINKYDDLNRPIETGIWPDNSSFQGHLANAYGSTNYPSVMLNYETHTQMHYDDYSSLPSGLSGTLYNSGYTSYLTASSSSPYYAEPLVQSTATKGMVTWTSIKVLGTTSQFLSSVNIYDEKGRVLQIQSINITGGLDVVTNQYSFSGQVLNSHIKHQKAGTNAQNYEVATKNTYDDLGRMTLIEKSVNGSSYKQISSLVYNALGQLQTKKLSPLYNGGAGLENLNYDYNIRGWLLGMNRNYVKDAANNYFGFDLGYDKNGVIGSYGSQLNGNIAGTVWKSAGDGAKRKYDFSYDPVNRLTAAGFTQWASGSGSTATFNTSAGIDYSVENLTYDANGNIKTMWQKGWKITGSDYIDKLAYSYQISGAGDDLRNKLLRVSDAISDPTSKLGDFKDGTNSGDDYSYDVNGNLTLDNNKSISSITYNYLNLPGTISITGKGTISYVYDANGNKLQKTTVDNTVSPSKTTTTLYLFGTYENDVLQFLPQEEGRIRPLRDANNNITSFTYDYFIKDHLGNVRMVLTEDSKADAYPAATLEPSTITNESAYYSNLTNTQYSKPSWFSDPVYSSSTEVARLKNSSTTQKIGPAIILKVMAGDSYNIRVASGWSDASTPNNSSTEVLNDLVLALSNGLASASAGKATQAQLQDPSSGLGSGISSFLNTQSNNGAPKAYINWVLFDEQFKYYSGGFDQVKSSGSTYIHLFNGLTVPKNGYLYVYTSNESTNIDVFFDNLQVTQIHGPILEETHYYPFGLQMSGISSQALGFGQPQNKKKFNAGSELQNKEFSDGSGLEMYDTKYRGLDPQIGRWWQIDPKPNYDFSLYSAFDNNPVRFNDPLGDSLPPPPKNAFNPFPDKKINPWHPNLLQRNDGIWPGSNKTTSNNSTTNTSSKSSNSKGNNSGGSEQPTTGTTVTIKVGKNGNTYTDPTGGTTETSAASGQQYGKPGVLNYDGSITHNQDGTVDVQFTYSIGPLSVSTDYMGSFSIGYEVQPGIQLSIGKSGSNRLTGGITATSSTGHVDEVNLKYTPSERAVKVVVGAAATVFLGPAGAAGLRYAY